MTDNLHSLFFVFLAGSGGQLVDGTLGMGFGVFSVSLLLMAGFPPASVVATVNIAKILTGCFSGLAHWRAGNVRLDWLLSLILPGIVGGVLGARLLTSLHHDQVRPWIGVVLVGMGILILWRCLSPASVSIWPNDRPLLFSRFCLGLLGLAAGFFNGISGAYGPVATSAVILLSRAHPSQAVGTVSVAEIFVAAAAIFGFVSKIGLSNLSWDLAPALILGGAVTAPLAAYACRRLPSRMLTFGVGVLLIALNVGAMFSWVK